MARLNAPSQFEYKRRRGLGPSDGITLYYRDGKSDKVYEIWRNGSSVLCRWGRRNSTLQEKTFSFSDRFSADDFLQQKIAEKRAKGYRDSAVLNYIEQRLSVPPQQRFYPPQYFDDEFTADDDPRKDPIPPPEPRKRSKPQPAKLTPEPPRRAIDV